MHICTHTIIRFVVCWCCAKDRHSFNRFYCVSLDAVIAAAVYSFVFFFFFSLHLVSWFSLKPIIKIITLFAQIDFATMQQRESELCTIALFAPFAAESEMKKCKWNYTLVHRQAHCAYTLNVPQGIFISFLILFLFLAFYLWLNVLFCLFVSFNWMAINAAKHQFIDWFVMKRK